ncbi:hypothetical protein SOVF_074010 [Spinacia oleracea]|nr:hypothetical protein SOVF_074010 [Spinacia oleracea]
MISIDLCFWEYNLIIDCKISSEFRVQSSEFRVQSSEFRPTKEERFVISENSTFSKYFRVVVYL